MKQIQISLLLSALLLGSIPLANAQNTPPLSGAQKNYVSRGLAVHQVVETFNLKQKNAAFIADCLLHLDECFFVFTAMSRYDDVSLEPLRLYPDVPDAYSYAADINLATMLGLVHGNIDLKGSPFYPRSYMTRIQALKVVLGSAGMMDWREKFELIRDLGNEDALRNQTSEFADVNALRDDTWWYPRYVNFALDTGVVDAGEYFRPDEPITEQEYNDMLQRALKESATYNAKNSKNQARGNSSQQTVN